MPQQLDVGCRLHHTVHTTIHQQELTETQVEYMTRVWNQSAGSLLLAPLMSRTAFKECLVRVWYQQSRGESQGCQGGERRPQRSGAVLAHDSGGLEWCLPDRKLREVKKAGWGFQKARRTGGMRELFGLSMRRY